jgi:hypothetical protein
VNYADNTFTMPAYNVTVSGEFERMYTITVASGIVGGSIEIEEDLTVGLVHQSIYLYITADEGYQFKAGSLSIKQTGGTDVPFNSIISGFLYYFTMPASNVTVSGEFERVYTVTLPGMIPNGSITASSDIAPAGATITLTINPNSGYRLKEDNLSVTGTGGTAMVNGTGNTRTFTMPAYDVTVSGGFERVYTVTVAKGIIGGSITASPTIGPVGTEITLTIEANSGYHYQEDSLIVKQIDGTDVPFNGTGDTRTFTMPAYNVTVSGEFDLEEATIAIEFTGFGDEDIDLSASDYTLPMGDYYRSLTVTVRGDYDNYHWYVDENLRRWENSNEITVYGDDFNKIGPHTITAVVEKDGVPYSKNLTIMVVR